MTLGDRVRVAESSLVYPGRVGYIVDVYAHPRRHGYTHYIVALDGGPKVSFSKPELERAL